MQDLLVPFVTIAIAEFLDKSQLAIFLVSSKVKKHFLLLCGVMLGFFVVDGSAIFLGGWIATIIPPFLLKLISSLTFIIFGVLALRNTSDDQHEKTKMGNPFFLGFTIIFLAEWGDKTQIAAALFATKYHPLSVLVGVMLALLLLAVLAVYVGKYLSTKFEKRVITKISGIVFILLGILFLFT